MTLCLGSMKLQVTTVKHSDLHPPPAALTTPSAAPADCSSVALHGCTAVVLVVIVGFNVQRVDGDRTETKRERETEGCSLFKVKG